MKYIVFMCCTIKMLISNWHRPRKFSQLLQAGRQLLLTLLTMVTLYLQFLCSDWSKFDRWVHAEDLCSILKLVYFKTAEAERVLCQLVMFLTVFFHWMHKMKFSCYCRSLLLFMASWFLVEKYITCQNRNPISDGIVFVFHQLLDV